MKGIKIKVSCRDCLLVKVDEPSGGDIDGCLRDDIIDELLSQIGRDGMSPELLDRIEELRCQEDESGFMAWKEPFQPKNPEELRKLSDLFLQAREKAYNLTKENLKKQIQLGKGLK